ncbi:MAG: beta-lactamase family protein [Burkholderiales bacterium]|nr:beta-lactamase family protein [Burkholderiales bacterium]
MNARAQFPAGPTRISAGPFAAVADRLHVDVEQGLIPGAVVYVARCGEVQLFDWCGACAPDEKRPMRGDALFWIASMTKPVTSAAAMLLVEEGRLRLDDPVYAYLPQLRDLRLADGSVPTQPARVVDLLRHTAGFTYGPFGNSPVHQVYERERVYDFRQTNGQMLEKLAGLPLLHAPGTTFEYGMSTDVLGRLIEVCSGEPLEEFLASRLFEPLGMHDTGFAVSQAQHHRVARPFAHEPFTMAPPLDGTMLWRSGGGGLWSTAADYASFAQMLLDFGELNGRRILARSSLEAMRSEQLPPDVRFGDYTSALGPTAPTPDMGQNFGLGLSLRVQACGNPLPGSVGDFGWPGVSGSLFWCDPQHALVVVVMLQAPSLRLLYRARCRELVYAALAEEETA